MATNFKVWIDNPDAESENKNVETAEEFDSDSKRRGGWHSGDTVSSLKMNTILRQDSLIVTALMEAFCGSYSTLSLLSSMSNVRDALLAEIAKKSVVDALASTVSAHSTAISGLQSSVNSLNNTVSQFGSGSTKVGDADKLDGQHGSYYQKAITSGTTSPTGGANGDIYIQYSN